MMGYGDDGGGGWMWGFGVVMMLGTVIVIGLAIWAVITVINHTRNSAATSTPRVTGDSGGRERIKQALDERYARGEMSTEDYSERLHTLGL